MAPAHIKPLFRDQGFRVHTLKPAPAAADAALRRDARRAAGPHPLRPPAGRRCAYLGTSPLLHHARLLTVQPPATIALKHSSSTLHGARPQTGTPAGLPASVYANSFHLLLAGAGRAAGLPAGRWCARSLVFQPSLARCVNLLPNLLLGWAPSEGGSQGDEHKQYPAWRQPSLVPGS